ncbi:VCBS repeat-containing protein [Ekhidna sp.]|uniref:FG-GAP repeat domain-containing protein n=1 Tax=Ekhidna sp. TaxID=2608089 RepID=UPI003297948D
MSIKFRVLMTFIFICTLACSKDDETSTQLADLGISASSNADEGSSYTNSKTDIRISYFSIPSGNNSGDLRDAIAYLDANGDGNTDVFVATGEFLLQGEVNSILAINDGQNNFTSSISEFNNNMPPATHARKTINCDFNGDALADLFVFDHGFDSDPFPGSNPKLIMQNSQGSFSWKKLTDQTGFHHGGAGADIDNDGDIDVFVGGFDPFFYINDGNANFEKVDNRFDRSMDNIFTAELIDVDKDGFVDLLLGAHEFEGDNTSIYWGSTTGSYSAELRSIITPVDGYGVILDLDAEDLNGDGFRDVVVNRTGGGNANFYQGSWIQILRNNGDRTFTDVTAGFVDDPGSATYPWFPWIRIQDIDGDGDLDIFPDNTDVGFRLMHTGTPYWSRFID